MSKYWFFIILAVFVSFSFVKKEYSSINKRLYRNKRIYNLKTDSKFLLSDALNKKLSVIVFHSTHCPFNETYSSKLDSIQQVHLKDSLQFIYINSNSSENQKSNIDSLTTNFADNHTGIYFLDEDRSLERLFNMVSLQQVKNSTIILCTQTTFGIKTFYAGPIDESPQQEVGHKEYLETAIQNALKNQPTANTAINTGCRIVSH